MHPGLSKTILLDETIFPEGIDYTVSLVDESGNAQALPWWITYIAGQRKLLMFPTAGELDQEFTIRIAGNDGGTPLESEFIIRVVNSAPVAVQELAGQRVKLGESFEYRIPAGTFYDADGDALTIEIHRVREDGTLTAALPGWLRFEASSYTLYGTPQAEDKGAFTLRISANDNLGGVAQRDLAIEAYNNDPQASGTLAEELSIHLGTPWEYSISSDLFTDMDGDALTYTVRQADGSSLPSWLTFYSATSQLFGTPTGPSLANTSLELEITATDGYGSATLSLTLAITNEAPQLGTSSLNAQLAQGLERGILQLKPGALFDFQFAGDTFTDSDGDTLSYTAQLASGDPLPSWLTFDGRWGRLYGVPTEEGSLSLLVTATDGAASVTDRLDLTILNQAPSLTQPLQQQFAATYPDALPHGSSFSFSFATDTFSDPDDALTYRAEIRGEGEEEWKSLESSWLHFDGLNTLSGTVTSDSIHDRTFTLRLIASDGVKESLDSFSFTIASPFPASDTLQIHSQRESERIELRCESAKLAPFIYNTVTPLDISDHQKRAWQLEGAPADLNHILGSLHYRRPSGRRLEEEESLTLRIGELEATYSLALLTESVPIVSSSIPRQQGYWENAFSLKVERYFTYGQADQLHYSYRLLDAPSDGGSGSPSMLPSPPSQVSPVARMRSVPIASRSRPPMSLRRLRSRVSLSQSTTPTCSSSSVFSCFS